MWTAFSGNMTAIWDWLRQIFGLLWTLSAAARRAAGRSLARHNITARNNWILQLVRSLMGTGSRTCLTRVVEISERA